MMASGIRLAARVIPRTPAEDATPEAPLVPASPLTMVEGPTEAGTHLARREAHRQTHAPARSGLRDRGRLAAAPVSAAHASTVRALADRISEARISKDRLSATRRSQGRASATQHSDRLATPDSPRTRPCLEARVTGPSGVSVDLAIKALAIEASAAGVGAVTALEASAGMATVGGEVFGPATATGGTQAFSEPALAGAGEVGALASDGRIGVATGDRAGRMAGIPGGTTPIGMRRGRLTATTDITPTPGTAIRRHTIRMLRLTTRQVSTMRVTMIRVTTRRVIPSRHA